MFRVYVNGMKTNYDFSQYKDFADEAKAREYASREGYSFEVLGAA